MKLVFIILFILAFLPLIVIHNSYEYKKAKNLSATDSNADYNTEIMKNLKGGNKIK